MSFLFLYINELSNVKASKTSSKRGFLKTPKRQNVIMTVLQTMKTNGIVMRKENSFGKQLLDFKCDCLKILSI